MENAKIYIYIGFTLQFSHSAPQFSGVAFQYDKSLGQKLKPFLRKKEIEFLTILTKWLSSYIMKV